jgi:thioredoxin reductase (NADPH)
MAPEADVLVVGAGPVGLFAVFALGQVGLRSVVVDALQEVGGQCAALYPEKPIYDIPTRTEVAAGELVSALEAQAAAYAPRYLLGRRTEQLSGSQGAFLAKLSDGTELAARAVVVAAGAGAFGPNRPPLPGLAAYEERSVFYAVRSPERFRDQQIVVAGGGDSAADWAVILAGVARAVTLVHRRASFRAAPATMASITRLANAGRLRVAAPRTLRALSGHDGHLEAVVLAGDDGTTESVPADALLCFYGLAKDLSALRRWDIGAERDGVPVAPETMRTSRPGVYAIGDIAHYPGKLKLILTGFAEAAAAAHAIRADLEPDRPFHFQYSTSAGPPGSAVPSGALS